jgi:prepilin-type N-terminal cleavage/methylation domain-containing protein
MTRRPPSGFTLLELLVAITVLSIVSLIAWRGLDALVATRERLEPEVDEIRALLTVFGQMERDLAHIVQPTFLGLRESPLVARVADGCDACSNWRAWRPPGRSSRSRCRPFTTGSSRAR